MRKEKSIKKRTCYQGCFIRLLIGLFVFFITGAGLPDIVSAAEVFTASFARSSVAYQQNGLQVSSGVPRYEAGLYGQALKIEEGTTNLLTANQASVETDTSGLSGTGSTISRDTTEQWHGAASSKNRAVRNPCVIKVGSEYRMWFEGESTSTGYPKRIGYATSSNGTSWTVNSETPFSPPGSGNTNCSEPEVFYDGSNYRMLFVATGNSSSQGVYLATSSSGTGPTSWTIANQGAKVLSNITGVGVLYEQGTMRTLLDNNGLLFIESRDGISWTTRNEGQPVLPKFGTAASDYSSGLMTPYVFHDGKQYVMYFTTATPGKLIKATSDEGLYWTIRENFTFKATFDETGVEDLPANFATVIEENDKTKVWFSAGSGIYYDYLGSGNEDCPEVLRPYPPGTYQYAHFKYPSVIKDGNTYKMWFVEALSQNNDYEYGKLDYAESPDGIEWTIKKRWITENFVGEFRGDQICYPRVIKDGSIYRMWLTSANHKVGYAESADGIQWELKNYGAPVIQPTSGTFYAYSATSPSVLMSDGKFKMWFAGKASSLSSSHYQIGFAEWMPREYQAVGMKNAIDTTGWTSIDSVFVNTIDASENDIKFLFSTDNYATVKTYRDNCWHTYLEGSWDDINKDTVNLFDYGMTVKEMTSLGSEELKDLLTDNNSLKVLVIFSNEQSERQSKLSSVVFNCVVKPATYLKTTGSNNSSNWNSVSKVYVTLIQPEYAGVRFLLSNDGGSNLKAYNFTSLTWQNVGSDSSDSAILFSGGMTREQLESLGTTELGALLPASTFNVYAIQKIYTGSTAGYDAKFYINYVDKYVLANTGTLTIWMDNNQNTTTVPFTFSNVDKATLQSFVEWVNLRDRGKGPAYFTLLISSSPREYQRIFYSKIINFDIREN